MAKHVQFYITLLLLVALVLLNTKGYRVSVAKDEFIYMQSDTTYQEERKTLNVEIPEPKVIVLDKDKKWKQELMQVFGEMKFKNQVLQQVNDSLMENLNLYSDTLSDENLDIYYNSLTHGNLLSSDISYQLKVPTIITNTVHKPIPTKQNQWLLIGEAGGNMQSFSNLSLGVQHISKKGWVKGYKYNVMQNTHNGVLGIKINR